MIREIREKLAQVIRDADPPCSVYSIKADDVGDCPCIVVDRPSVTVDVQHHRFELPVVIVGRREGDADAQSELDDLTWWTECAIAGPDFAVIRIEPATASIAELTFPAYEMTVSCGVTVC